jgi:hypothetical protein
MFQLKKIHYKNSLFQRVSINIYKSSSANKNKTLMNKKKTEYITPSLNLPFWGVNV